MKNTIFVLGGDGYLGWPLSMKLAIQYPDHKIVIIDNQFRRNTVRGLGFQTLIPIAKPEARIAAFAKVHGQTNIRYIEMDVNSEKLEEIIQAEKPHTIYHLAQQCSASYSMKGVEEALFTIQNNESGNMRLLWAVRKHVPQAHIIKLGSMGEYAQGGIDIAEGYFCPEHKGTVATKPMPYPRAADDIYHISKINDTNYIAMACRVWNLRITDIMQSTIFGFITEEMAGCETLYTRCDYDHIYGTVLNRFLTQTVAGHPLTVYGKGNQRTGLMALRDSVNSLASLVVTPPPAGTHKVINHVTETRFSINELAETIRIIAEEEGYNVKINRAHDPRSEKTETKAQYDIENGISGHDSLHTPLVDIVTEMLHVIRRYKYNIVERQFIPLVKWDQNLNITIKPSSLFDEINIKDETYWESFREQFFKSDRINLNPGTLGTTSTPVKGTRAYKHTSKNLDSYPLGSYEHGRKSLAEIKKLCNQLWPSWGYNLTVTHSTTQTMNLLALSMLRKFQQKAKGPYKIITTTHEHEGGIGCFQGLPEYEVFYIEDYILGNPKAFAKKIEEIQPDIAFFSHVFYDTGIVAPVKQWTAMVRKHMPGCKIVLDAAQSLGIYDLPFGDADMVLGSTHKWLFGPHGGGLLWMKDEFANWMEGIYWSGTGLTNNPAQAPFSIPGGQDFQMYEAIEESLKLFKQIGKNTALGRSSYLRAYFQLKLEKIFVENEIAYEFLNDDKLSPVIAIGFTHTDPYNLYTYLNDHQVHTKCIKNHKVSGVNYHILRIGVPYFETVARLDCALFEIEQYLSEKRKITKPAARARQSNRLLPARAVILPSVAAILHML